MQEITALHASANDMWVIWQDKCCNGTGLIGGGLLPPPPLFIRSVVVCSKTKYGLNFIMDKFWVSGNPRW